MMVSLHVNLLREEELRHQGVVSRSFTIKASVGLAFCMALLITVIALVNRGNVMRNLALSTEHWEKVDPGYEKVKEMRTDLAFNQNLVRELEGWNQARIEWFEPLMAIQQEVPTQIQLLKLTMRGSFEVIEKDSEGDQTKEAGTPARRFSIRLDGVAEGELADEVVNNFLNRLRGNEAFQPVIENLKLQGLRGAENKQEGARPRKVFGIEVTSKARKMME